MPPVPERSRTCPPTCPRCRRGFPRRASRHCSCSRPGPSRARSFAVGARRRAARARPWGARQLERFEAIGASRGRPRRVSETVPEFAGALDDPTLARAASIIERDLYSGRPVPPDDRAEVDAALTAAGH